MTLTDLHRTWLQTCAGRSCIPEKEALQMFESVWHIDPHNKRKSTEADMLEAINVINENLKTSMGQQISVVRCDVQRTMHVVFSDTGNAAIMKSQTNITEPERSLFHLLLKELATSVDDTPDPQRPQYTIDMMTAINLTNSITSSTPRTFSKQRAEDLIAMWTRQGYFVVVESALHFGPRSVAEFGQFLHTTYPEHVHSCPLCMTAVFRPFRCADCAKPYHKQCLQKYLARNTKCPSCKRMWSVRMSM